MNKLQLIKIALLIVILAEEIRSDRNRIVKVSTSIDEKELTKIVNEKNAKKRIIYFLIRMLFDFALERGYIEKLLEMKGED
ncbi:hypothetical protein ACO2EZ_09680 [Staphylococcus epidermidis]